MDLPNVLCNNGLTLNHIFFFLYVLPYFFNACIGVDLTYYMEEGNNPNTYLGDVASDSHLMDSVPLQDRNLIRFSLLSQGDTDRPLLFHISKNTGKLYSAQTIDAETLCTRNVECFKMVDVAVRKATSFIKILEVKIIIKDLNDHQPEFPLKQFSIEFSEDDKKGIRKIIPSARDDDFGIPNSQITYHLKKNLDEPFALNVSRSVDGTSELSIILQETLDREMKASYKIQVIAKDGGSPSEQNVLDVYISVTDVNDNPPVFFQSIYNVSVTNEHHGVSPFVILSASDLDSDKNGRVVYRFSPQTSDTAKSHFKLNEITGEIFLQKKFSSGQKLIHELYVKATDEGTPSLSSIAMVLVTVINQQNNAPRIDVNFVSVSTGHTIFENIEVGSFIAYVKVTDHDAGLNGEVTCDLHHDKFQLQTLSTKKYKVIVKNPVDRETQDHHDITIRCQDRGSPPLNSMSKFSIKVMDVNDEKPRFSKETYKFTTYENEKSKITVGYINATDPDLGPGGKLTYILLTSNKSFLPFYIKDNGLILTVMSLDHEFQDIYHFQVLVKDSGMPSLNNTVNVIVKVKDKNDNAPFFTFPNVNPFTLNVHYHPYRTNNITYLRASDSDSRENAFLKYEILRGNDKQLFIVNPYTGLLSFTRVVTPQDAGSYDLQLAVKDSGIPVQSAMTNISLRLTVSNKTSEVVSPMHVQSENKIQLYLVVVIVVIAITVSVPVTAAISICIIRCNNRRNVSNDNHSSICACEQRNIKCPFHVSPSWPGVPMVQTSDGAMSSNSLPPRPKKGPNLGTEFSSIDNCTDNKAASLPPDSDIIYQVSVSFSTLVFKVKIY